MMDGLKGCPFCGGRAHLYAYGHRDGERFRVTCGTCSAEVDTGAFKTPDEARDAWNRRDGEQNETH